VTERRISLLIGVVIGVVFVLLFGNYNMFYSMLGNEIHPLMEILAFVGFLSVLVFGFALIIDAYKNVRKQ
jgi:predicted histidine transporter YuiF (NhaC family)